MADHYTSPLDEQAQPQPTAKPIWLQLHEAAQRPYYDADQVRGVLKRLDALMRSCREDHHTPTYSDLLAVKGDA